MGLLFLHQCQNDGFGLSVLVLNISDRHLANIPSGFTCAGFVSTIHGHAHSLWLLGTSWPLVCIYFPFLPLHYAFFEAVAKSRNLAGQISYSFICLLFLSLEVVVLTFRVLPNYLDSWLKNMDFKIPSSAVLI